MPAHHGLGVDHCSPTPLNNDGCNRQLIDPADLMARRDIMRNNNGSKHDGHVNMNADHGLGHEHDGQTHVQAPEEMHRQAARRLSFDSWLPHNNGNEVLSSSHIEQMDHVIEPYVASVGLTRDGVSTPKKTPHVPTRVSFLFLFLFQFGDVKNFCVINLVFVFVFAVFFIYTGLWME
jgi:hypothetical protein